MATKMTREEAVALLERYSNYEGLGIPNLAGCKEAMKVAAEALKEAYPELAESEDERIRKRLIEYFEGFRMGNAEVKWEGLNVQEVLVWLEKQKEQNLIMANSPQLKEQKQEKFPPYVTGFKGHPDPAGTSDLEEAAKGYASKTLCDPDDGPSTGLAKESFIAGAEWQKEQKPAEWSEEDEEILKLLILNIGRYMYFGGMSSERILSFLKSLRSQPKQEWSEEDEKTIDDAYCWLCEYAGSLIQKNYGKSSMLYGIANKLKSLHFHPKQEWSDEEKEILDSILSHYVLIDKPIDANGISKEKYISLIKSLRFDTYRNCNSHWKPSEEQMAMLLAVINEPNNAMAASCHLALKSLYEQLKQL